MEIDQLVRLQRANRQRLKDTTAAERVQKLDRIRVALDKRLPELIRAVYADLRRPEPEILLSEVYPVMSEIRHARRNLPDWLKPTSVPSPLVLFSARSEIRCEPKGTVLIIAPWNFPFQLAVAPLVSAIAAGNTAVVKPSELAPRTAAFTESFLTELFDPGEIAVVEGDRQVAQSLVKQPFDHIFFTGGANVGRDIMATAARNLTSVTLELGGKSPAILDRSADVRSAAFKIVWGKCLNAGQSCVAPDYVLLPRDMEARFIDCAREAIEASYGPSRHIPDNVDYGRIVNRNHFQRAKGLVESATRQGARIEAGGTFREEDAFIAPTLLGSVPPEADIMKEEIFAPVLPIVPYRSFEEAVVFVNSRPRPLALYVFGRNANTIEDFLSRIPAGGSVVNDVVVHFGSPYLPFGGLGHSGMGKAHGFFGFRTFSNERPVLHQPKRSFAGLLYPPYSSLTRKLIRLMVRFL